MKKLLVLFILLSLFVSACLPGITQQQAASPSTPLSEADLQGTAAVYSQQTLQALPSPTILPSETPVVVTPTATSVPNTPTETQNPVLLTLTATLGTGTVTTDSLTAPPGTPIIVGTLPFTGTPGGTTSTQSTTPHPMFYGTLPPDLPYGVINLFNKSKADAYISLRCVTKDGYVTILEYPVKRQVKAKAPAGNYTYVAWVGGRQFTGSFSLPKDNELLITLFKDKVTIKKN